MRVSVKTCVIANCVLKFTNFRYNGNKGRSGRRLNDNVSLARTVTPAPLPYSVLEVFDIGGGVAPGTDKRGSTLNAAAIEQCVSCPLITHDDFAKSTEYRRRYLSNLSRTRGIAQ